MPSISPGDDVEAWCTRCRMNLNHRVIAVVGSEIHKVHCLTCGGDHRYYPPKHAKPEKQERRTIRVGGEQKSRRSVDRSAERAMSEWKTIMNDRQPDLIPRPYLITDSYQAGEFIEHPTLGTGRVMDVLGSQRIEVIFQEGRKVLVCNRPKSA